MTTPRYLWPTNTSTKEEEGAEERNGGGRLGYFIRSRGHSCGGNIKFDAHSLSTVLGASRRALRFGHLLEVQMPSQQVRLDL